MELPENEDVGYEVDDSGEYVSESKDGLGLSQLDLPTNMVSSGNESNSRRVVVHRSGSVTVTNAGDANDISAISNRSDKINYNENNGNSNLRLTNKIKQQASRLLDTHTALEKRE